MLPEHPFLDASFLPRWSALTPAALTTDLNLALKKGREGISELEKLSGSYTYANTLDALREITEGVSRPWGRAGHLTAVCDHPELRQAYTALLPEVSAFFSGISLNPNLWRMLLAFAETAEAESLTGVRKRHLEETLRDFREAGADLPQEKKDRLAEIDRTLAQRTRQYSENVLDATNAWELIVDDEARLKGLPARAKAAALANARQKGLLAEGKQRWRFTLHFPSLEPFMTYLEDDDLRREMWEASTAVGRREPHDNQGLVKEILALRQEKATLLGTASFADLVLRRRMAKSGDRAIAFLEDLYQRSAEAFARENTALQEFKASLTSGTGGPLEPWEIAYYSEKERKAHYDLDEEDLRPYFPIDRVIEGLFTLTGKVFGLRITEQEAVYHEHPVEGETRPEVWHPEVKFYSLHRIADGTHLGSFYADWHPRESKRGGAWMNYLHTGGPRESGEREPHLGLICGNLTPSSEDGPALLTHREVETIFHEFGHLLHHLLGEVEVKSLNGVNVAWDFVELPSQIMENWCWHRESLDLFARHFETGETLPPELFRKMLAARRFRAGVAMMRQLQFARMDLELHHRTKKFLGADPEPLLEPLLSGYRIPTATPQPSLLYRFSHLFSSPTGYAAGYYSYKWSEVLDADAFTRFQEEGILNPKTGQAFVETILSQGNSAPPEELFRRFMGRDPDLLALLKRSGLV